MSYHYLAASLPELEIRGKSPYSVQEFFNSNKDLLSYSDMCDLDNLINERYEHIENTFIKNWIDCETQIRNTLVKGRTRKLNIDTNQFIKEHRGFNAYIDSEVSGLIEKDNPLEREIKLDMLRWSLLDELSFPNTFEIEKIFSFVIKLKIVSRWEGLSKENGRETIKNIMG